MKVYIEDNSFFLYFTYLHNNSTLPPRQLQNLLVSIGNHIYVNNAFYK